MVHPVLEVTAAIAARSVVSACLRMGLGLCEDAVWDMRGFRYGSTVYVWVDERDKARQVTRDESAELSSERMEMYDWSRGELVSEANRSVAF